MLNSTRAAALFALWLMLAGCGVFEPYRVAQTTEQRAGVLLGDFNIYQQASLSVGQNAAVPVTIRLKVVQAARAAKAPADQLDAALREYQDIRVQILTGQSADEKLRAVSDNLERWVVEARPLIEDLGVLLRRAQP